MKNKTLTLLLLLITTFSFSQDIYTILFADGFSNPVEMQNVGDDRLFIVEKRGVIEILQLDGTTNPTPFLDIQNIVLTPGGNYDERGLLGLAFHPDYINNGYFYVNYIDNFGNTQISRFSVSTSDPSIADPDSEFQILEVEQPYINHNGGCLRFGPEGYLWVGTGDRHRGVCPQDNSLACGVVLRMDGNGKGHPKNKIKADKRFYTYGHRNVQRIDFRPSDGRAFTAEHGPWHNDEITALVNGGNGGWDPKEKTAGRVACPDQYCGYEPNQMEGMTPAVRAAYTPMSDTRFKDLMPPAWNNNGYSQGTGSAAFLKGKNWGIYEGRLATGIMGIAFGGTPGGMRIDITDIAKDGLSVKSVIHMPVGASKRFRGLEMGPDNALYATTDEGEIFKISAQ